MKNLIRGAVLGVSGIAITAFSLMLHAQTADQSIQSAIAGAQALAASQPVLQKTIPLVSDAGLEASGTYWSLQLNNQPPLPFDPFPELETYSVGDNTWLIDDRSVDYPGLWALMPEKAQLTMGINSRLAPMNAGGFGAGPLRAEEYDTGTVWLEMLPMGINEYNSDPSAATLLLHNPTAGAEYLLQSRRSLTAETAWASEYPLVASAGETLLAFTVSTTQRPMLFFRIVDISPTAVPAFYGVNQNSSENQLDVFEAISDPNDDYFYISDLVPAQNGDINYSLDASTFHYTPQSGFYGMDTFTFSITNLHGGTASAPVTVFINQNGNSPPSADDVTLLLQTDVYTATFNAAASASDPDGDNLSLIAATSPVLGASLWMAPATSPIPGIRPPMETIDLTLLSRMGMADSWLVPRWFNKWIHLAPGCPTNG